MKEIILSSLLCMSLSSTAFASGGWNDKSPEPDVKPSPSQPCDSKCMKDNLKGWSDKSPDPIVNPSPFRPCDEQCMRDSLKGWQRK